MYKFIRYFCSSVSNDFPDISSEKKSQPYFLQRTDELMNTISYLVVLPFETENLPLSRLNLIFFLFYKITWPGDYCVSDRK